jgi:hypothetical protein
VLLLVVGIRPSRPRSTGRGTLVDLIWVFCSRRGAFRAAWCGLRSPNGDGDEGVAELLGVGLCCNRMRHTHVAQDGAFQREKLLSESFSAFTLLVYSYTVHILRYGWRSGGTCLTLRRGGCSSR